MSVVFVDEIDSLCRIRSRAEDESSRRVKTEFLVQMQRLHNSENPTLLVCATNCPWELDSAFLRRGVFSLLFVLILLPHLLPLARLHDL
ncbi:Vacuolar protein sorting-associated protein 4A [Toxocara canis]|uniref:Vacuolar protein sorting-associated protein 4A n=1 Tax=Toxocara canis TaxID=6265 RepID=A0A0B2VWV3_TOXCA|nr:Vacuolar protein sorting-associated protein 4A [Toxocara canis]